MQGLNVASSNMLKNVFSPERVVNLWFYILNGRKSIVLFRKAIKTDIPQLIKFRKILLCQENNSSMDETFRNYFDSSLSDKSIDVWVADDDGVVVSTVGFCLYRFVPRFENPSGWVAYMTNVFTIPNYRRQGIVSLAVDLTSVEQ
jgi:ribosomal protein S18 acetylase RimI-like enzyme